MANWAHKILKVTEKSANYLILQKMNGRRLLLVESMQDLIDAKVTLGAATKLWPAIEKMKMFQNDKGKCH